MIKYRQVMFNTGIVFVIVSALYVFGFFEFLFGYNDENICYAFLTGGVGVFLIVPKFYYDAKKIEEQYGNMSIRDRVNYVVPTLFGVFFVLMFFFTCLI